MRKLNSTFKTAFVSEEGVKLVNRDYFAHVELDKLACYVLADGLDEDPDKKSAEIVVESIIRNFIESPAFSKNAINTYISKANKELKSLKTGMRLKASIVVVITDYAKVRYALVGNSRFYLMRNNRIMLQSKDQSLTRNMVEDNQLSMDKIARHAERNNLYEYMGQTENLQPFVSGKIKLQDGDTWLLLSRGTWEYCDDGELVDACQDAKEPEEIMNNVEELILSKQPDELDNYTMAITFVDKIFRNPDKKRSYKKVVLMIIPFVIIGIIIAVVLYFSARSITRREKSLEQYLASAEKYMSFNNYIEASEDYDEALKLADSLGRSSQQEELDRIIKVVAQILLADQSMRDGDYQKAYDDYVLALALSNENGNVAKEYIEAQMAKTSKYHDVHTLIAQGDQMADAGNPDAARAYYIQARDLAATIFYAAGKQEAVDKISEMDAMKAEQDAAAEEEAAAKEEEAAAEAAAKEEEKAAADAKKAEEAAAAEEARKVEQEKEVTAADEARKQREADRQEAMSIEAAGDLASQATNFNDALIYYYNALEIYQRLNATTSIQRLQRKINLTNDMIEASS